MKKIVRALVIALALTGAVGSIGMPVASAQVTTPRPADLPIPTCPPNDPNACVVTQNDVFSCAAPLIEVTSSKGAAAMNGSYTSITLALMEPIFCIISLFFVMRSRNSSEYKFLKVFLIYHLCSLMILTPLLLFGGQGNNPVTAYRSYFYGYWINFTIETVLSLLMIFSIFDLAMAPFEGIRRLGVLIFRWVASISLIVAVCSVFVPHHLNQEALVGSVITELQRTVGMMTLCLLLFVGFAIKPLGLSYKSRIFGIGLGLGILVTTKLGVFRGMMSSRQLYSQASLVDGAATCLALLVWIVYFATPELKRRIVVLPTTSPFLRWNQISLALGDSPGFVAVGGIPPELFSSAELEVMRRASLKMVSNPAARLDQTQSA